MEYRKIGSSQLVLPAITFGAWAIGPKMMGGCDSHEALKALRKAFDLGVNAIDTAAQYGLGYSEELVGKMLQDIPRDKIKVLTKCGMVWYGNKGEPYLQNEEIGGSSYNLFKYSGKASIIQECENSLRRLGTDYIDHYSLHWPDSTTPVEETMEAFEILQQQGKILHVGVCNHSLSQLKSMMSGSGVQIVSNKVRYSMLNREPDERLTPYCSDQNISIFAYCLLQRGILSGQKVRKWLWRIGENPREAALYGSDNTGHIKKLFSILKPLASDYGVTLSQLSIRWALEQPGITIGLLGAVSAEQVAHDAGAINLDLDNADKLIIQEALTDMEGKMNWGQEVKWTPNDHEYYFE
ncbi:aldo/keto reductase [Fulvivirga maritima]|uniref:aldo/keto reductase n=1 Tax=Fulvivirga maritima TaxID=2904247 RepID=UPI001F271205|nr:aldo/keto reductase [Fulvivirga maritima]UII27567.1 aldo/keto reductase [Fulvivirga maritima]